MIDLGFIAGQSSRFNMDPSMTRAQYEAMYRKWVKNSCLRKVADEVFALYSENDLTTEVAFITLARRDHVVSIGLIAVSPVHQRKGLGMALINRAKVYASEHCLKLEVATQSENIGARRLYEKAGFQTKNSSTDYHMWLPRPPSQKIKGNMPYVTFREKSNMMTLFKTKGIESCGSFTIQCQRWLEKRIQSPCVLLCGSATAALDQAAIVLDLKPGDEVILPSYTFVSTANCFVLRGAVPVFVDVRSDTLNIDETKIEAAVTPRTKAICVVHYAGLPCEMDTIMEIAKRRNLLVIEDAAQAFLSCYKGRPLGSIGHLGCFSFHYTKNVICGEGGALCINDAKYVDRSHIVWEKGTNRFSFLSGKVDKYWWVDIGSSFVPNELTASFLMAQLVEAERITAKRRLIFDTYANFLKPVLESFDGIDIVPSKPSSNGHIFWICFKDVTQRQHVQKCLSQDGIECFTHYVPLHRSPAGERFGRTHDSNMEMTEKAGTRLVRLPIWNSMNWQQVYAVIKAVIISLDCAHLPASHSVRNFFTEKWKNQVASF